MARTHPHLYPQWCNALALELAAVGNLDDARTAINTALASPIADRFPEYQATSMNCASLSTWPSSWPRRSASQRQRHASSHRAAHVGQ